MPDSSYNSNSTGDGVVGGSDESWDTIHDSSSESAQGAASTAPIQCTRLSNNIFIIQRGFFPFDTSGLPDDCTIISATLTIYAAPGGDNLGDKEYCLVQSSQASDISLANGDFDLCGDSIDSPTEGAPRIAITSTGSKVFTLNSTGLGWISKTGYTSLGV